MADAKCFCHLNGYEVKDATARNQIANLELVVNNNKADCTNTAKVANEAKTAASGAASAASAAQTAANEAKNSATTNANNISSLESRVQALEDTENEYVADIALSYDSSTESLTIGTEVKIYE